MADEEYLRQAQPLLSELGLLGYHVSTVGELRQRYRRYQDAIPVLQRWLPEVSDFGLKLDIAQTLAARWIQPPSVGLLVDEYRRAADDRALQWQLGEALAKVADARHFEEIEALAKHQRYGKAREMVVLALGNMRDRRAVEALLELLADEEVSGHAIVALGKLHALEARDAIAPFLTHRNSWVRTAAKRALAKIERAATAREIPVQRS